MSLKLIILDFRRSKSSFIHKVQKFKRTKGGIMEPDGDKLPSEEDSQQRQQGEEGLDWDRKEGISIGEVIATLGFTHLTGEQAEQVVNFVEVYCMLVYSLHQSQLKDKKHDTEEDDEQKNKAA